ncbi:MAG TPA: cytochrome C oxidase subunit II [Deltaproteobacteria bacterium]|nr:cytochrome C oxidase subunit II [Deltaproteobacteria bacterium]
MILNSVLPEASTYAADIDRLFDVITLLVGVPFLIASFLFFSFIFRFKKREGTPAKYITGTEHQYMKWIHRAHVPILLFDVIIVVMAVNVWYDVKQDLPEANSTVRVIAQQWAWTFVHPGPDNVLDTADDIVTINELHVAKDTLYHYKLEALDVLHDFSVPAFRLKQDAIPGRVITGWFEPTLAGEFGIQCAEICGIGHGLMPARLIVEDRAQHAAWIAENSPLSVAAGVEDESASERTRLAAR